MPDQEIIDFVKEMKEAGADWQMMSYGNAVHSYTNPDWPPDPSQTKATAYNETADRRSWLQMQGFLDEIFAA